MKFFALLFVILMCAGRALAQTPSDKPTRNIGRPGCTPGAPPRLAKTATNEAPEFGDLSEITDCHTVYVEVRDLEVRQKIVKELQKDSKLTVVGNDEDADFFINYDAQSHYRGATVTPNAALGPQITNTTTNVGEIYVTVRGRIDDQDRRHTRIIWTHKSTLNYYNGTRGLGKQPEVAATREFLKQLNKARAEKNNYRE